MKPKHEKISLWQLFTLIVTFEAGSAIVVNTGGEAKQDAWLAVLIAMVIGMAITWVYYRTLGKESPGDLFLMLEGTVGRWVTRGLIVIYTLYFFYSSSRVLRDFGELITTAILLETPLEIIVLTMLIVVLYILYLGVEVLARTAEIFAPYMLIFLILITILILISGELQVRRNIEPVLGEGLMVLLRGVFPGLMTFPFGEMVVFMMIMPKVSRFKLAGKVSVFAVGVAGFLLSSSSLLQLAALGVDAKSRSTFPLLSAARLVSIANFIERIDALVVFIVMLGIIIKVSVLLFAGLQGLQHLFQIPYRSFLFPVGMIVSVNSILISINFAEHIEEGLRFVPFFLHLPLQYVIPTGLFLMVLWGERKKRQSSEGGR
ncbi:MAG: GerAB/ArcD/ProY family transporter [Tumebacillaceae bacterium]